MFQCSFAVICAFLRSISLINGSDGRLLSQATFAVHPTCMLASSQVILASGIGVNLDLNKTELERRKSESADFYFFYLLCVTN